MPLAGDRAFVLRSLVAESLREKRGCGYNFASAPLVGEYDTSGTLIQELVWLGDIPVATIRTDQGGSGVGVFYIHTDHLNAPQKITRPADNAVIWRWDHDPFGNGAPNEDPDGNGLALNFNLRYPGQYFDSETGLYYNYFRYFDPQSGRYISSDPIGLGGGINTYAYVEGNPISFVDPDGLAPGDTFDSEAAARRDMEEYLPAIHDHNNPSFEQMLVNTAAAFLGVEGRGYLIPVGPYQVDGCKWTWNVVSPSVGYPPNFGKKPGKLGRFKGTDALRRENNIARDAAKAAGLNKDQARQLHDEISGQGLTYQEILQRARDIAGGK